MIIGYGRVSSRDQNLNLQEDALRGAGCEQIFMEKASGTKKVRPELDRMRSMLRPGDTLVIWRLDRLGRSLIDLVNLMNEFRQKEIRFRCITMEMDTATAGGRLLYNIFAALAEYVRDLIVENTQAGLSASRARGIVPGRKKGMSEKAKILAVSAMTLYKARNMSTRQIAEHLHISTRTLYKYLEHLNVEVGVQHKQLPQPALALTDTSS